MTAAEGREMRITVPGNLLLMGEYAVLEAGGLGLAIATEPRLSAHLSRAPRLEIVGTWGGGTTRWPEDGDRTLFAAAVRAVAQRLGRPIDPLPLRIEVDSTPFYGRDGAKTGFGSSAAVAVAVSCALLRGAQDPSAIGLSPEERTQLLRAADAAHRDFQQGRGSGYDIAASVYGGIGRFAGGAEPELRRIDLPWFPGLVVFPGRSPVRTVSAVGSYQEWKANHPAEAREFLEESNQCVEGFLAAPDWPTGRRWLETARDLGLSLGSAIGVPASIDPPDSLSEAVTKAVGAGNELGVALAASLPLERRAQRLLVAEDGVVITPTTIPGRGSSNG